MSVNVVPPFGTQLNASLSNADERKYKIKKELNSELQVFLAEQSRKNPRLRNRRFSNAHEQPYPEPQPPVRGMVYLVYLLYGTLLVVGNAVSPRRDSNAEYRYRRDDSPNMAGNPISTNRRLEDSRIFPRNIEQSNSIEYSDGNQFSHSPPRNYEPRYSPERVEYKSERFRGGPMNYTERYHGFDEYSPGPERGRTPANFPRGYSPERFQNANFDSHGRQQYESYQSRRMENPPPDVSEKMVYPIRYIY